MHAIYAVNTIEMYADKLSTLDIYSHGIKKEKKLKKLSDL